MLTKRITLYNASLYPNAGRQEGRIDLYCADNYRLFLFFSNTFHPNTYDDVSMLGVAYQPFSQFQYYLDLVRNEKPIFVRFRTEDIPPTFVIFCTEPPGDSEWVT